MIENTVHHPDYAELREFFEEPPATQPPATPVNSLPAPLLLAALEALMDARIAVALGALPKRVDAIWEKSPELEERINALEADVQELKDNENEDIEDAVRDALDGAEISVTINRRSRY